MSGTSLKLLQPSSIFGEEAEETISTPPFPELDVDGARGSDAGQQSSPQAPTQKSPFGLIHLRLRPTVANMIRCSILRFPSQNGSLDHCTLMLLQRTLAPLLPRKENTSKIFLPPLQSILLLPKKEELVKIVKDFFLPLVPVKG